MIKIRGTFELNLELIKEETMFDNKDVTVILDYGHGGISPVTEKYVTRGKRSPNWTGVLNPVHNKDIYYEGVGNQEVGELVEAGLKALGINYIVTRNGWKDIGLQERCDKANSFYKNNKKCFFTSLHSNAGGGTSIEVYTSPGNTDSDPMATICIEEFPGIFPEYADKIRTDVSDGDPDKEARFTVLMNTHMPAFLPEAFFMDREKECKEILMKMEGKVRIAKWYVNTIKRIITELY